MALVSEGQQHWRNFEAKRFCGPEFDQKLELAPAEIARLCALKILAR